MMQDALAYNVFARRQQPALRCAIPQGNPVPPFIQGKAWEFSGTVKPLEWTPAGFQPECAHDAIRVMGYYLFYSITPRGGRG